MSNKKKHKMSNTLSKIKTLLGLEVVVLAEAKLVDGTNIGTDADAFADGVLVYVLGEDGEKMPLPSGAYEMDNGSVMEVVDGEIVSMKEAEPEAEEELSEETKEEVSEDKEELSSEVDLSNYALKSEIADAMEMMVARLDQLETKMTEMSSAKEDVEKELADTKEELSKVSKMSAEKSFKHKPVTNKKEKSEINLSAMDSQSRVFAIFNKSKK